jgi:hypothetical protein
LKFRHFLASVVVAISVTAPLRAQGRPVPLRGRPDTAAAIMARGTIDGFVSDTGLAPLHAAFFSIVGTNVRIGTGPNGRFRVAKIPVGRYLVVVRRVGYHPISATIDVSASDTLRLAYTLEKLSATELEPVVVTERAPVLRLREFEARRRAGIGQFMDQDEIERKNPVFATELMRKFLGLTVSPTHSSAITEYYALSTREGGNPSLGACPMQVYLDQIPLPTPFNLDLLPSPKEIAGIEVYAGSSTIPPQFNGYNHGCGVILVWTRGGT